MTAVLNIVELQVPIDAKPDVLGTRSKVAIGENNGEICAPRLGEASYREAFAELHPPRVTGVGDLIRVFNHGARGRSEEVQWGRPTRSPSVQPGRTGGRVSAGLQGLIGSASRRIFSG